MPSATASQRIPELQQANIALMRAFESHAQFPAQQAQRKGKIYFMHDFAARTNAMFESLLNNYPPPDTPATRNTIPNVPPASMTESQRKELTTDAIGRCVMLHELIDDTSSMAGMMFGEMPGQEVDVGDAVKSAADAVNTLAG